ncbi:DUF1353 domain-containing protein [Asticcacaulis sp. SL142]|uniref:DUF1353 domain-containing protein n=1 Tax=Asticcacaulis sp. SL142 TaxID=2995155 RepID=UPI00226CE5F7|nr:DUF1353 domain-containing protein [Asticcacaulis sp. SL142]WAC49810.1 DUF1353 domain-containing protein [Asticcacaulis sp. SL142]
MVSKSVFRAACEGELDKPYIWGGSGPVGYDCSGFVQWALSKLNLDPPGDQTAEGLYRYFAAQNRASAVTLAESTIGDIVFFGSASAVTHVALCWDDGNMLEAGGGGRTTVTPEIARQQGACVRIRPVTRRRDRVAILRPQALAWTAGSTLEALEAGAFGRYEGQPVTLWLSDGRHMQLKSPYAFVDDAGLEWPVPAETIVDGASIPNFLWSVTGGPFEGQYRNASIIHDYYCDEKTRTWQATHEMFYGGMRCSGVGMMRAKTMFYAVYRFGPRWTQAPVRSALEAMGLEGNFVDIATVSLPAEPFDAASLKADAARIAAEDLDIAAIKQLAEARRAGVTQ